MTFAARLVAYSPGGARLSSLLLDAVDWDASFPHDDVAALSLSYPSVASAASELVDGPVEIAVEVSDGGSWVEPRNARFLSSEVQSNDAQPLDVPKFTFRGLGALLERPMVLRKQDNPGKPYDSDDKRNFLSATAGQIVLSVVQESRAKYSKMLDGIEFGFTASADSLGKAWNKLDSLAFEPGTDLLRILDDATARGICDWWMQGRTLHVVNADSAAVTRSLRLNLVEATEAPVRATFEGMATRVALEGAEGRYWEKTILGASVPYGDKILRSASDAISTEGTALDLLARNAVQAGQPRREYTRAIAVIDSAPLLDWQVGDWLQIKTRDTWASVRVFEAGLSFKASDAVISARVTLNDRFVDASVRDAKRLRGIAHGTTQNLGSGGIPSRSDKAVPAAPKGVAANSLGYWLDAIPLSSVDVSWQAVNTDTNGLALNGVDYYEVSCGGQRKRTSSTTIGFDGLQPSRIHAVTVRAVSSTGVQGKTAGTEVLTAYPLAKLDAPTTPTLRTSVGAIQVSWDGNLQGTGDPYKPPLHFSHILVETRLISVAGQSWVRWSRDNGFVHTGLTAGDKYEVRLVAVDMLGEESDPSPVATVTVESEVQEALDKADAAGVEALEAKTKAQTALDEAFAAQGGVAGALTSIQSLDTRLTADLTAAQSAADAAGVTAVQAKAGALAAHDAAMAAIVGSTTEFAVGTSDTTAPTSGWVWEPPTRAPGEFVWMRTTVNYANGSSQTASPVLVTGNTGADGDKGDTGVGVTSILSYYLRAATKPAKPTVSAPSGWTQTEPAYVAGQNLYRSEKVTYSNGSFAWSDVSEVSAYTAASLAMTAADGKATITYGTVRPSSPKNGDRFYNSANGKAEIYSGSAWRDTTPGEGFVPALDIGSGTAGDMSVGRLTVVGGAQIPTAVIDRLVSDQAFVDKVVSEGILVTPGNLMADKTLGNLWTTTGTGAEKVVPNATSGRFGGPALTAAFTSATQYQLYYGSSATSMRPHLIPVTAGREPLVVSFWARSVGGAGGTVRLARQEWTDTYERTTSSVGDAHTVTTAWQQFTTIVSPTASATWLGISFTIADGAGTLHISDVRIERQTGAILMQDGAVTAPKITASQELSAKVAEFIEVETGKLTWNNAAGNRAFIGSLVGDQAFVDKVVSEGVLVTPGNLMADKTLGNLWTTTGAGAEKVVPAQGVGYTGGPALSVAYTAATQYQFFYGSSISAMRKYRIPVYADLRPLVVTFWARVAGAAAGGTIRVARQEWDSTETRTVASVGNTHEVVSYWRRFTTVVELTSTARWAGISFTIGPGEGNLLVSDVRIEQQTGTVQIQDGAVTAPQIFAQAITAEKIAVGALDAFQITAPLIQSVSTANRGIKWNGNSFVAYNNSGVEMIRLEGDTGAITGVTITGGTVRTAASGQRIQLVSSGDLYAYSTGNVEVLRLQSSDADGGSSYFYGPTNSGYRSYLRLGVGTIDGTTTPQAWLGFNGGDRASNIWVHGNGGFNLGGSRGRVTLDNSSGELRLTAGSATGLIGIYNLPTTTTTGQPITTILGGDLRSLYRNTSLRKYKLDVADLSADDPYRVLKLQPRDWYDRTAMNQVADGMEAEHLRAQGEEVPERLALREAMPLPHRVPGFVAEEVVEVIPELASWDGDGNLSGVAYDRVAAYLLVAVKAMKTEIDQLRAQLETEHP